MKNEEKKEQEQQHKGSPETFCRIIAECLQ
jgi:hypothetical protein